MIVTKSAAKQVQRLQAVKCLNCIHPLVQKWESGGTEGMRDVTVCDIGTFETGDSVAL